VLGLTGAAALLLGLGACDAGTSPLDIPGEVRTADLSGIAQSTSHGQNGSEILLAGGRRVETSGLRPFFSFGVLRSGALVLAGTGDDPWYGFTSQTVDKCFQLPTRGVVEGDWILTELGVRIPKAATFTARGDTDGVLDDPTKWFCLNSEGEATSYGGAAGPN
jgi:hypothetical protein